MIKDIVSGTQYPFYFVVILLSLEFVSVNLFYIMVYRGGVIIILTLRECYVNNIVTK